jgi:hypothetical protein
MLTLIGLALNLTLLLVCMNNNFYRLNTQSLPLTLGTVSMNAIRNKPFSLFVGDTLDISGMILDTLHGISPPCYRM